MVRPLILWTTLAAAFGCDAVPAVTTADLEADWLTQARVSPENLQALADQDAAKLVDGVKSGKAEHQTRVETWAWWQVDLGAALPLDRVLVYNPVGNFGVQAWFKVLLSTDGVDFQEVHQLEGPTWPGNRILNVALGGRSARWVRVSAGGRDRLRLSEVEVFGQADPAVNLALRRPATQSSYQAAGKDADPIMLFPVSATLARGQALAAALATQGVKTVDAQRTLEDLQQRWQALGETTTPAHQALYLEARQTIRSLLWRHPRLAEADRVLFLKRALGGKTHCVTQFNSEYARPGGGIYQLDDLRSGTPTFRRLGPDLESGSILGLDLSWDAQQVIFAHAVHRGDQSKVPHLKRSEESFYHLYSMDLATGQSRRLTHGRYDDFHGMFLPEGGIICTSTRRSTFLVAGWTSAQQTLTADVDPAGLRCGAPGVFTLHRLEADGSGLRTLSPTDTHEWSPALDSQGRVIYTRWDYVDRDARIAMGLWATNPDGSNPVIIFGNYTRTPYCINDARPIPGSWRLVCTGGAHHAHTGGPILILDPDRGLDGPGPLTNLTPEVCMPESEGFPLTYYQAPWPLSDDLFLCAWSPKPLCISTFAPPPPPGDLGLYLYDRFGNRELLHRDPLLSSTTPVVLAPRQVPPHLSELPVARESHPHGSFLVNDVYQGLTGIPRGTVRRLRVVALAPKPPCPWGDPFIGPNTYEPGKFVLGTVPVEADGSAGFVAPANIPLFFQALGEDGRAVQTMRSATYLQGGERRACIGCHDQRQSAPGTTTPLAARRPPSRLRPDVEGSWPLRFDRLVEPTVERLRRNQDPKLAGIDFGPPQAWKGYRSPARTNARPGEAGPAESWMWKALVDQGGEQSLYTLARQQDCETGFAPSVPGRCLATIAPLWGQLTAPIGEPLNATERAALALWMDLYVHYRGHFSPAQEADIAGLRQHWADLLEPAAR